MFKEFKFFIDMTRKGKRHAKDIDPHLQAALNDPNAIVRYNHDGTWAIEHVDERVAVRVEDMDAHRPLFDELVEYSRSQGLPFLTTPAAFVNFYNLVCSAPKHTPNTDGWEIA